MNHLMRDAGLDREQRYFFAQQRAENYMREFRLQGDARPSRTSSESSGERSCRS
jgi:hypothetical protein